MFFFFTDLKWQSIFDDEFVHDKQSARTEKIHVKACKQKYFIAKKFINPADYNIGVASINASDCKKITKEIKRDSRVTSEVNEEIESFLSNQLNATAGNLWTIFFSHIGFVQSCRTF
jgi:hypothetical protein